MGTAAAAEIEDDMSRTYNIVCHDCKQTLWIGQGWPEKRQYIYKTEEQWKLLERFLFNHQCHRLEFGDWEHLQAAQIDEYFDLSIY